MKRNDSMLFAGAGRSLIVMLIPQTGIALPNTIVFIQKTGVLRYCTPLGFQSICTLIDKNFSPAKFDYDVTVPQCVFVFQNANQKVHLFLKDIAGTNKKYIFGSSYIDNQDFHKKVIAIAQFVSKHSGCSFFLDDATNYQATHLP